MISQGPRVDAGPDVLGVARKRRPVRDDRRNVYVDGKSNLVIKAFKEGNRYYGGKINTRWEGTIGRTFEARIKFECLTPGAWPAFWLSSDANGEIDIIEWYGNGEWAHGTTVHALANGSEFATQQCRGGHGVAHLAGQVGRSRHELLAGLHRGRGAVLHRSGGLAGGLAVQQPGLQGVPDLEPRGRRFRRWGPDRGHLPVQMLVDWIRVW